MSSTPITAHANEYKVHDAASYDAVAEGFERYTERFTVPMAQRVVGLALASDARRLLDVGCGTGIVARLAAARPSAPERIVGVDLSDGMLDLAVRLADAEFGPGRIAFRKGDAEKLDFADSSFDVVTSLYALRHFPNPQRALAEMMRVLRPGGTIVVGVGSAAPRGSRAFFANALRELFERTGALAGHAPLYATAFLDQLVEKHVGARTPVHGTADAVGPLGRALVSAGCTGVTSTWIGQSSDIGSAEDFWNLQLTLSTRARKAWPELGAQARSALREEFDSRCAAQLRRGGRLVYRSGALIAAGQRAR